MRFGALIAAVALLIATAAPLHAQVTTDADFIQHLYGLSSNVTVRTSSPSVGTTPTLVGKNAPARFAFFVVNLSANSCYGSITPTVSATNGFLIVASGGLIGTNAKDDLLLPTSEWWIVCAAPSSQLYVQEIFLQ